MFICFQIDSREWKKSNTGGSEGSDELPTVREGPAVLCLLSCLVHVHVFSVHCCICEYVRIHLPGIDGAWNLEHETAMIVSCVAIVHINFSLTR